MKIMQNKRVWDKIESIDRCYKIRVFYVIIYIKCKKIMKHEEI